MIVVSDTSPINYLVLIELQDLLPELFQRVLIPDAVHRELQSTGAPDLQHLAEPAGCFHGADDSIAHLGTRERVLGAIELVGGFE